MITNGTVYTDLSKGNGRENECSQESYDGKGAHGGSVWRGPQRPSS